MRHASTVVSESNAHAKDVIEERRATLGLTQEELARTADISLSTLQRILRGHKPLLKQARALEDALEWQRGSLGTVLADGEPTLAESEPLRSERPLSEILEEFDSWIAEGQKLREEIAAARGETRRRAG